MPDEKKPLIFKYVVGYNFDKKLYRIGYTRQWLWHQDVANEMIPLGYTPRHAGFFSVEVENNEFKIDTVKVYGKSEGLNIPCHEIKDLIMVKSMLEGDNNGDLTIYFNKDLQAQDYDAAHN